MIDGCLSDAPARHPFSVERTSVAIDVIGE